MKTFEILPVFPSVISATKITEDFSTFWNNIVNIEFTQSRADDSYSIYTSKNLQILDDFDYEKKIILDYFYEFKNEILKLQTTNFQITTSWVTKTETNGFCQYHRHKNSYYSGILYNSAMNEADSGTLLFTDSGIKEDGILVNEPVEKNIYNTKRIIIEPDKNLLLFFPSNLSHRISKYTGIENRYSLAFNLFPIGKIGSGDSSIDFDKLTKRL